MSAFMRLAIWSLLLLLTGCVEPYAPEAVTAPSNYLVINGFIDGNGTTRIRLSRSVQIASPSVFPAERRATVVIENQAGQRYYLTETDTAGLYTSKRLTLPANQNYRLYIRTSAGREYASDYTPLKIAPAFDQLEGRTQTNGLQLYLSTHDDQNQTRYYRWQYEETWEFTSAYESLYRYAGNNKMVLRKEDIYHCWRIEPSTTIVTTSTVRLSQDAVRDYRLLFIPRASEKLLSRYSILVRQYGMSQAEFDYWEAVKKNTENIGTLFDPLPSQIQGNVHCLSDAQEPVLGFVGASTVVAKRIFIERGSLPREWIPQQEGYEACTGLDHWPSIKYQDYTMDDMFGDSVYRTPVTRVGGGYTMQTIDCVDCRIRGTNRKPSYWP
ncbi:DUF4249 domain-containing protein [Hymenobacter rigui]|uniref:DUF4249 domain-containing protein n=1 Tax=Hymenobacter rigui TaxID=334424 RepID=A0A428KSJ7_9BACT|nr:DUF4249 domain-containing protein [Hymenobacter rigui]RSK49480.1 DUF4249 domain-containing protein [Hymenobacter rigui]